MHIERVAVRRLRIPLKTPYRLSITTVEALDTFLFEVVADGRTGYGEATVLNGYTDESVEGTRETSRALAECMLQRDTADARRELAGFHERAPFATTAAVTAIEMLEGHPLLQVSERTRVPLLAIVNASDPARIEAEVESSIAQGYGTLKVKVGFDPDADLQRVALIQRLTGGRARIRLDGNQGYSLDEALHFIAGLNPEGIELLEQPCAADDWDAAVAVARRAPVPMMLDESIYGVEDVERAARLRCADYIKFKLMKAGGLDALATALSRIRELGMEPVLGNGVAADVGCWMEACVAARHIRNAGEMNGFLKPVQPLAPGLLCVEQGAIVLEPGGATAPDPDRVAAVTEEVIVSGP